MLVEINSQKLQDGVVVYSSEKGYETKPLSEVMAKYEETLKNLNNRLTQAEKTLDTYNNLHITDTIKDFKEKLDNDKVKERLCVYMAFELLNDSINYEGNDYPSDYEECQNYILNNMEGEMPKTLSGYVNIVKGVK